MTFTRFFICKSPFKKKIPTNQMQIKYTQDDSFSPMLGSVI